MAPARTVWAVSPESLKQSTQGAHGLLPRLSLLEVVGAVAASPTALAGKALPADLTPLFPEASNAPWVAARSFLFLSHRIPFLLRVPLSIPGGT